MPKLDSSPDTENDDAKIEALKKRIAAADQQESERTAKGRPVVDENYHKGNRVLADLIAGIGGGALIGWFLDRFFATSPWLMLVFLFMGIIVAFRNIIKNSGNIGQ
ncbi:hypothetical protein LPB140_06800 [Sphingorhabdus lutea]|uniref:ATP synthase protein I n=1 Tax=Sphingorhabdus lutea TaxID=1913578 RepID=A0A1L3JBN6_9SPHN|nr:AtpZ/AtpI family protein [Sphingorhabdus lutea]APG62538.1 hypothetical protein LPB140_06800 [Sphingorhabdus lutea]